MHDILNQILGNRSDGIGFRFKGIINGTSEKMIGTVCQMELNGRDTISF